MSGNPGNFNATKHGAKSPRHGLVLVALGNKYPGLAHDCRRWGRCLEGLVREARGKVTPLDQERICCAVRWELTARVAMRLAGESQDPGETLARLELASKATQKRYDVVAALGLDKSDDSSLAWLYSEPASGPPDATESAGDPEVTPGPSDAPAATVGDVAALPVDVPGDVGDAGKPPDPWGDVADAGTESEGGTDGEA